MTLQELGRQYLAEAERLNAEIEELKKQRSGLPFYSLAYAVLSTKIKQKQTMADEAEMTAYKLIDYYRR